MSDDYYRPPQDSDQGLTQQYSINRVSNTGLFRTKNSGLVHGSNVDTATNNFQSKKHKVTEKDFQVHQQLQPQSFSSSALFFWKHSVRDLKRRKCHYCLAFCSVFIVVVFSLIVNTIVARGPIIFLKMAEGTQGEIDGVVTSNQATDDFSSTSFSTNGYYLNYSRVEELYQKQYMLAPRKQFCGVKIGADTTNSRLVNQSDYDDWKTQFDNSTGLPTRTQAYDNLINFEYQGCLMMWDTDREREIGIGRTYKYEPLEYGECNINKQYESLLDIQKGDIVYFSIQMPNFLNNIIEKYNVYAAANGKQSQGSLSDTVQIPCKVKRFTSGTFGKFPNTDVADQQVMEIGPFIQLLANYLPTQDADANTDFKAYLQDPSMISTQEFSDVFVMSLPEPRIKFYESSNYDDMQRRVTIYADKVTDALGYFPIQITLSIFKEMEQYSTAVIFLGLIFDIIILMFIIISVLLIYSLLMISVETKTFEIGVMRMVGLSTNGLIFMIIIQGTMFVIPAIIAAFALCFPALKGIYTFLFTTDMGITVSPAPDGTSVLQALILGLCIPLLSSILPIRSVLTKNLNDALDYQRSKTQAIYVKILDKNKSNITSYVLFGIMTVIYGLAIYYFLPLAMLSLNYGLILKIFFFILVGMLFGLSMLAFNIQRILEVIFTHVFLFYEKQSMKMLVLKNLTAHKMRNKFTSIIYSLALGFMIFLIVSYTLQLESAQLITLKKQGSKLILSTNDGFAISPQDIDPILAENSDLIESYAYVTFELDRIAQNSLNTVEVTDRSRINSYEINVYGVTPYIFDATIENFLKISYQDKNSGLSFGEQLYTARGCQGLGMGQYIAKKLTMDRPDLNYNKTGMLIMTGDYRNIYYQQRAIFTTNSAPAFTMTDMQPSNTKKDSILMSLPMFSKISGLTMDDLMYERLIIKLKNQDNLKRLRVGPTVLAKAHMIEITRIIQNCIHGKQN